MFKHTFQIISLLAVAVTGSIGLAQEKSALISFKVLYNPPTSGIGALPGGIFEARPGVFYTWGGFMPVGSGATIYSIDSTGSYQTIHQFPPSNSVSWLLGAENGLLYGFGNSSPALNYFSMKPDGSSLTYYPATSFGPASPAIPTFSGFLFDTMGSTPAYTLARVDLHGNITTIFNFASVNLYPTIALVRDRQGNFYGAAQDPNNSLHSGWIYRVTPGGQFTKLAPFDTRTAKGATPALMSASDGNLYGAFQQGGRYFRGSIFRLTPQGQMTTIIEFPASGPASPDAFMQADDGYTYGSTAEIPSYLFRFNPKAPKLDVFYQMSGSDGTCACLLVQGSDGKFYGVAPSGGINGTGTIFTFDVGLKPPKPALSLMYPTRGGPGTRVLLWGKNLLGTTAVSFNGTPAIFGVTAPQSVFASVPAGATTGPITITTPNGSYTTGGSFPIP